MNVRWISVSLDTLLDTRLGIVAGRHPDVAQALVGDQRYHMRVYENWSMLSGGKFTNDEFRTWWAERNTEDLKRSVMTSIVYPLGSILARIEAMCLDVGEGYEPGIDINIWPYDLDPDEVEALRTAVSIRLGRSIIIVINSIPLNEYSLEWINRNYAACVLYDFDGWYNVHAKDLLKTPIPTVSMLIPKIFAKDPGSMKVADMENSFKVFVVQHIGVVSIEPINAEFFSVLIPSNKKAEPES